MVANHPSPSLRHGNGMTREEQVATAAGLLAETHRYRPDEAWRGPSGLPVTGAEIATFLGTVVELLDREKSWTGGRDATDDTDNESNPLDGVDDTKLMDMVRAVFRWLREELRNPGPTPVDTAWLAMHRIADSKAGDNDTRSVAERCVDMILRARTGASTTSLQAWEQRAGRSLDDVRDLLETAAVFAHEYGPTEPDGAWRQLPELRYLVQAHGVWTQSGMTVSGDQVADCIAAATKWLEQEGWGASTYRYVRLALQDAGHDRGGAAAAGDLLDLMVQHRTGAVGRVGFDTWEKRPNRTWAEVSELLAEAATFAQQHGPASW